MNDLNNTIGQTTPARVLRGPVGALVALAFLAGCQTSGGDGVLSNALPTEENTPASNTTPGTNPNAVTRLKNTRTSLTDYCPAVRLRAGTETFRVVPKNKDAENSDNVRYQATITKVARECKYVGQNLEIKVGARGRVITGPSGEPGSLTMPIRVAVTEGGETIYSKLYRQPGTIDPGKTNTTFSFVDENVVIPAPRRTNVRVFVGFDEGPYNTP